MHSQQQTQTTNKGWANLTPPQAECDHHRHRSSSSLAVLPVGGRGGAGGAPLAGILLGKRGVDRPTYGREVEGEGNNPETTNRTHKRIPARDHGAKRREALAPPSWGGKTTYKNKNTNKNVPLVYPRRTSDGTPKGTGKGTAPTCPDGEKPTTVFRRTLSSECVPESQSVLTTWVIPRTLPRAGARTAPRVRTLLCRAEVSCPPLYVVFVGCVLFLCVVSVCCSCSLFAVLAACWTVRISCSGLATPPTRRRVRRQSGEPIGAQSSVWICISHRIHVALAPFCFPLPL